jgi:nitrite reductase (NO-forming)
MSTSREGQRARETEGVTPTLAPLQTAHSVTSSSALPPAVDRSILQPNPTRPQTASQSRPQSLFQRYSDLAARPARRILHPWDADRAALAVIGAALVMALILVALVLALTARGGSVPQPTRSLSSLPGMSTTPLGKTNPAQMPTHTTYDAQLPPVPGGTVVNVHLTAKEVLVAIAPGEAYQAWTFDGTVPGPILHVRQGQTIHFTLTNGDAHHAHSIDFHAAQTPWNKNYQSIGPGQSQTFDWQANYPGVFMYHCGTPPVMDHMANGMYGAIIVDPAGGWAGAAQDYVLVQSEFYTQQNADTTYGLDEAKLMTVQPDYVTFNGYANQYREAPLTAKPGQKIRLFLVNAGPSQFSAFHVIGALFSDTYADGNPANHQQGNQTITIPPGGGAMVELTIPEAGQYPFVTHSFAGAMTGAVGVLNVQP